MREQINKALDLWDFDLARILLSCSDYKEEYEIFLYETGQFDLLKTSLNYRLKVTNCDLNDVVEGVDLIAYVNKIINEAIAQNNLTTQKTYELFHKIKFEKFLLGKAYFLSKIIAYFATKNEEVRVEFFIPLAMYSSPQNLLLQVLQKDFGEQKGAKKTFDAFISEASLLLRKCAGKQFLGSRVAICFHGVFRGDFEGQISDTLDKLAKPLNADVFIFTWDKFQEWGGLCGGVSWSDRLLDKELAENTPIEIANNEKFQKYFPNTFEILNYEYLSKLTHQTMQKFTKKHPCIKSYVLENQDGKDARWGLKTYYSMQKSFALMQDYENQHNIRYDFVVFARPDYEVTETLSLEDLRKLDLNEICEEYGFYGTGSLFPYGRTEAMRYYVSLAQNLDKVQQCSYFKNLFCNHDTQSKYAMYFNLKTRDWKYKIALYNRHGSSNIICLKKLKIPNIKEAVKEDLILLGDNKEFNSEKIREFQNFFDRLQVLYESVSKNVQKRAVNQNSKIKKSHNIFGTICKFFKE